MVSVFRASPGRYFLTGVGSLISEAHGQSVCFVPLDRRSALRLCKPIYRVEILNPFDAVLHMVLQRLGSMVCGQCIGTALVRRSRVLADRNGFCDMTIEGCSISPVLL
jgi:hypothetical protein